MTKPGFDYNKWIRIFRNWERACSDAIAKDKVLWGLQNQVNFTRDIQTMLEEMRDSVPNTQ